ncbi:MAG: hypothetical protein AB7Q17_07635 [Phycisphaerae bacterium]
MIDRRRLVTPPQHLDVLFEPAGSTVRRALCAAPPTPSREAPLASVPVAALRATLRARLGLRGPVVVTGHQAELFHAGVFAKCIAAALLAERVDGTALFALVDSDTPKTRFAWTPRHTADQWVRHRVPLPGIETGLPMELQPGAPASAWRACFDELVCHSAAPASALWDAFAGGWLQAGEAARDGRLDFVDSFGSALRASERALGLTPPQQVRVSALARMPEFTAFALHLMRNAEAVAGAYNAAQARYRQRHRIRHPQRPVPPLGVNAERIESPFWVLTNERRRERLWVGRDADALVCFAGESAREPWLRIAGEARGDDSAAALGVPPPGAIEAIARLRPRALTLTAILRLLVADLFIHGIGGAKYDEITDEFGAELFGAAPAPIACVTATLHLPLEVAVADADGIAEARRRIRDLRFNPQRYVATAPRELVAARAAAIARADRLRRDSPGDRGARRAAWEEIRRLNAEIAAGAGSVAAALERGSKAAAADAARARVAYDREYCFALHPLESVAALVRRIGAAIESPA